MSIIEENTFRIRFPAREELKTLLVSSAGLAVLWSTSWSAAMPTHHLPGSSIVSVNVPARFDVPCVSPRASHAQRERGPGCFHHFMDVFIISWMCILAVASVSLQHGEASFSICSFWWAETLLPAGTGDAGTYWNLPEMCKITIFVYSTR